MPTSLLAQIALLTDKLNKLIREEVTEEEIKVAAKNLDPELAHTSLSSTALWQ